MFVTMQGSFGAAGGTENNLGQPASVQANVSLTSLDPAQLEIFVPTGGQSGGGGTGGAGGSGSLSGNAGGGGGGGAVVNVDDQAGTTVLVAGGGGGSGGDRNGSGGAGGNAGGVDSSGPPPSDGVWKGSNGSAGNSDNPGAGGAGGTQSDGYGTDGGDAESLSGNGGGGGGGGGWLGGSGGEPGQASLDPFATAGAGGGGGGGSSYADPTYTTLAVAGPPITLNPDSPDPFGGYVTINWVDILTTALRPMRAGRTTDQQLAAATFLPTSPPAQLTPTWSAAGLPEGLTLSASGALSGKPKKSGPYSFVATAQGVTAPGVLINGGLMDISSVITYSGTVCDRRCGRGGRT